MTAGLVQLKDVTKRYGDRLALSGVDFGMEAGETIGLIGPNGAGKTTLLRILAGLVRATSGSVEWSTDTPAGAVGYFAGGHTIPPAVRAAAWVRLVSQESLQSEERRAVRKLSRGSRQMIGLQSVLAVASYRCLLLDEPWEGLDPDGSRWLAQALQFRRKDGCAVLLSSHRLHDLAGQCDRYAFLIDGRLVLRSSGQIREDSAVTGDDLLEAFDRLRAEPG